MFDPASIGLAISVGSKAFGLLKQGIAAGREIQDMASQLSEWGKAVSDIAYAAQKANEPPGAFRTLFGGGSQKSAIDIFAAQKQCQQQRKRKELIEGILEAALWTGIILATSVIAGFGLYFWGRYLGRW